MCTHTWSKLASDHPLTRPELAPRDRRICRRGFTDSTQKGIFALGSLPLWGNSKFYLGVRSVPGVSAEPPFSPILDSTARADAVIVRELADSPPLACMFGRSHLYFTCIPPVSHTISLVSPCVPVFIHI